MCPVRAAVPVNAVSMTFPPDPVWVRSAREAVRTAMSTVVPAKLDLIDTAMLLTSEAVTNAVVASHHSLTPAPIGFRAGWTVDGALHVLVQDLGPGMPDGTPPDGTARDRTTRDRATRDRATRDRATRDGTVVDGTPLGRAPLEGASFEGESFEGTSEETSRPDAWGNPGLALAPDLLTPDPLTDAALADAGLAETAGEAEEGRGMLLITSEATDWGVCQHGPEEGKSVWFSLGWP